ncbi:MAG: cyclic peptide export ABC transporter [Candidatus Aminicenantes bacterium]|jgi:cyclic peptide transporter
MMKKKSVRQNSFAVAVCLSFLLVISIFVLKTSQPLSALEKDQRNPSLKEIEQHVQEWMEAGNIPGLTLVIVGATPPVFVKGYGYADLETKTAVTPETLFELASCSKSFTALATLLLQEKGLVNLDSPVSKYLPWFYVTYQNQNPPVTIRQLLHHTSGIPWESFSLIPKGSSDQALKQTVRKLAGIELNHMPGQHFEYATINYDIVGAIIEKVTGESFESYMKDNVFTPLGLSSTFVGIENKGQTPMMATGYKKSFFRPRKYTPPVLRGNNPAAYVISNGKDMARWLNVQMGLVETDFNALINQSHQADTTVNSSQHSDPYGMGWFVAPFKNKRIYHTGLNPNFTAYTAFHPTKKIGVAVLANSESNYTSFIGDSVLRLLTGQGRSPTYPKENKIDVFSSIASFVLGVYVIGMMALLIIRMIGCLRGRNQYEPLTRKKVFRVMGNLLGSVPFLVGIYIVPQAFAGLNWHTALLWLPLSFIVMILLLLASIAVSYIYYILSLVVPHKNKYRNEIPLITVLSVLSGLANMAILFIVTTAFFSNVGVGYLLYYFGLVLLLLMWGRKIIQTKMIKITNNIVMDLRIDLINIIFSTRYQQFEKIQDGRIFTTLNGDTDVLSNSAGLLIEFITSVITTISGFIYMITISVMSTMVVFIAVAFLILYFRLVEKASRVYLEGARDTANVYVGLLNSLIKGFKELSIQRRKKYEFREDLLDSTQKYCSKTITANVKFLNARIIGNSVFMIILGILSIVISRMVKGVNLFTLISFVMVVLYLLNPIQSIMNVIPRLANIKVSWNRIKGLVNDLDVDGKKTRVKKFIKNLDRVIKEEPINLKEIRSLPQQVKKLKVEGLCFEYEPTDEGVKKGFSVGPIDFEVDKGEILFIIGGNGSGKTTLAKLITGLYQPHEGVIKVNGKTINNSKIGEFFSTVFNDYHVFKKLYSIDFNGRESDITKYLKLLRLDNKVSIQNSQYSTLDLSGGQKKRLALFNCYLESRPIYLFDELAANQDPGFRKFFYRELLLEMKKQGKIVIAVTHDDHYFDVADKIIKMDMGKIDMMQIGAES